jgi:hypothetical protein
MCAEIVLLSSNLFDQKMIPWFEKSYRMPRTLFYMIHDLIRPVLETRWPDMAIRLVWFSTAFQCTAIDCVLRNGEHPDDLHVYGVGDEAILTLMISPTLQEANVQLLVIVPTMYSREIF